MTKDVIKIHPDEIINLDDPEKFFHELNLLRLEGYVFDFSRYRKPSSKQEKLNRKKQTYTQIVRTANNDYKISITIDPDPRHGRPKVFAYKLFQAALKKCSDYGLPFPSQIYFTGKEIERLLNRKGHSGVVYKQIERAIQQLRKTDIKGDFFFKQNGNKNNGYWKKIILALVGDFAAEGEGKKVNRIVFSISPYIVDSFNRQYIFILNHHRLKLLQPIGQALFKRLFFHFSNLYSNNHSENFEFRKDYAVICRDWLGGLEVRKYKAYINRQLGEHFKKLKQVGLIKKFPDIEPNAKGDGFNISFTPGKGFFEDYAAFYSEKPQMALPFQRATDERFVFKPINLVKYFYENLHGTNEIQDSMLNKSECDYASLLLEDYSYEDIKSWIDYSIEQSRYTGFKIKTFNGIKNFKTEFLIKKEDLENQKKRRLAEEHRETQKKAQERLEKEYSSFQLFEIEEYRKSLTEADFKLFEAAANEAVERKYKKGIPGLKKLQEIELNRILADKAEIPTFEEWQKHL